MKPTMTGPDPSLLLPAHPRLVSITGSITLKDTNLSADLSVPTDDEFLEAGSSLTSQHLPQGHYNKALTNKC